MLPSLAPELLSAICAQIDSKQDLSNFSLCSKAFYDLATPHLYRDLALKFPAVWSHENELQRYHLLRNLTLLFIQKPKLASYVRTFSNRPGFRDGINWHPHKRYRPVPRTRENLDAAIEKAIQRLSHSKREASQWTQDADYGDDAFMAVLISRFTRVEVLDLEIEGMPTRVPKVLQRIGLREKPFDNYAAEAFANLRSVAWFFTRGNNSIQACAGPLLIQSVREVYFFRVGASDANATSPNGAKRFSNVELVQLADSCLTRSELSAILETPRSLKSFIYEVGWHSFSYIGFSLSDVHEILSVQKASLEDLWLDHAFVGKWPDEIDNVGPLASLQGFVRLRRLAIAVLFVFGEDRHGWTSTASTTQSEALYKLLPRQLETLHLTCRDEQFGDRVPASLRHLLELKRDPNILPHLKDIRVDVPREEVDTHVDALAELLGLARDVETELTLLRSISEVEIKEHNSDVPRGWGWDEDVMWRECSVERKKGPPRVVLELVENRFCEKQQ